MSIIERAAGKIGQSGRTKAALTSGEGGKSEERDLIESSIDRVEASFGAAPPEAPSSFHITAQHDDDGPPTILSQKGSVNLARLKQMGVLTPEGGRSKIAEEYRLIKRPLLSNAFLP